MFASDHASDRIELLSSRLAGLVNASTTIVLNEMRATLMANAFSSSLASFTSKVATGHQSRIRLVGGSITVGAGVTDGRPEGQAARPYSEVFERELRAAWPNATLDFDQFATGGVGSRYYSSCLDDVVPRETDLVVLDVSINDIEGPVSARSSSFGAVIEQLHDLGVGAVLVMNWRESPYSRSYGSSHYIHRHQRAVRSNWDIAAEAARTLINVSSVLPFQLAQSRHVNFWDAAGLHPSYFGHRMIGLYLALLLACAGDDRFPTATDHAQTAVPKRHQPEAYRRRPRSACFTGAMLASVTWPGDGWNFTDEGRGKLGYVGRSAHGSLAMFDAPQSPREHGDRHAHRGDQTYHALAAAVRDPAARSKLHTFANTSMTKHANSTCFWVEVGYLQSYSEEYGQIVLSCGHCECNALRGWWSFPVVNTRDPTTEASVWASTIFVATCPNQALQSKGFKLTIRQNITGLSHASTGSKVKVLGVKLHPPGVLQR